MCHTDRLKTPGHLCRMARFQEVLTVRHNMVVAKVKRARGRRIGTAENAQQQKLREPVSHRGVGADQMSASQSSFRESRIVSVRGLTMYDKTVRVPVVIETDAGIPGESFAPLDR